jgi:hypothetical protein
VSTKSLIPPSLNSQPEAVAPDDASSRIAPLDQTSKYDTRSALGSAWYGVSLFQVLRYEIRSLVGRIRESHETELYQWGIAVLPRWFGALIGPEYLTAQRACNEDTQRISQSHKWMSLVDNLIFLQGWTLGAAWAYRNQARHSEDSSPIQSASGNLADSERIEEVRQSYAVPNNSPRVHT